MRRLRKSAVEAVERIRHVFVLLGCLGVIMAAPAAYAQDGEAESVSADEANDAASVPAVETEAGKQLWFVELESPPSAEGTSTTTLDQEKDDFREEAQSADIEIEERYAFDKLFNGLSLEIDESDVDVLGQLATVKAVYPVEAISPAQSSQEEEPEKEPEAEPGMANAVKMTGADIARDQLGYDGAGVKIGVVDTGIDYDHPDLGAGFGPGRRVVTGYDFVGDNFDSGSTSPANRVPEPDDNPDDCNGHGTHVAGIIGANGEVKGVAPGVTFGAYRVFGCSGTTTADVIVKAMERALGDDVDLLNMSLGASFQAWPQYPTAQASDRLVQQGVPVVASAGNDGASGLYAAGAPGVGDEVIGVASFDNTHVTQKQFTISPDNKAIGYRPATDAPAPPISGSLPMARTGTKTSTNDACNPLPEGSLTGKAALIRRGTCSFYNKALNAQNAGAAAVVLYNDTTGFLTPTVEGTPEITIPVVLASDSEGATIDDRLASGAVTMTWTNQTGSYPNPTGGLIASSSSYGMSADLKLKPDIGAPGGSVWSTYPLEKGAHASLGGTSMATPHVAGAVALLLEAKPNTSSQAVRGLLQNSADPKLWGGNPSLGFLDNVHRQGAGMLDIDDAIQATTKIEPGKLSLGESQAGPSIKTLTIENDGSSDITYDLSHTAALATGSNTFTLTFFNAPASVSFSSNSVTIPAGGKATVSVTIRANSSLANKSQYGGYLVLTPRGGGQAYRVPYAGFKGDYQSIQALAPTANNFPWLAKRLSNGNLQKQADGATYTLENGDVPYFLWHLDHQVRRLQLEVKDANTGESWYRALDLEYLARNTTSTGFSSLPWDGKTKDGNNEAIEVPNGKYKVTLSVQKALGDYDNPAHWETWTSPPFEIKRPPPAPPEITSPESDGYDNDGDVTLSGTAGAKSTVEVFDGEASQGTTTADDSGAWSKTLTDVSDGEHSYTARVTSSVRGNSSASNAVKVIVDTAAPSAPKASFLDSSGKLVSPAYTDSNGVQWFKDAVTVHYGDSSDGSSGSCIKSYTADQTFTDSGSHDYSGTATDYAGNESSATTGKVGIDKEGPTPGYELSASPNKDGWNNKDVTVTLEASDEHGGSGFKQITYSASGAQSIDSTTYAEPFTIHKEGTTDITYEVEDNVGNVATDTIRVKLDKTPPVIHDEGPTPRDPDGKNNWYTSAVTNAFSASDETGGSGLADPSQVSIPKPVGEGNGVTVNSGSVRDVADNVTPGVDSAKFYIDLTDPATPTFSGIHANTTYPAKDLPAQSAVSCSASDEPSGLDRCDISGYSSDFGSHTLTATAYDKAGRKSTSTLTYTVGLQSGRILSPVNATDSNNPLAKDLDAFKIKSVIPVKFQLYLDGNKTQPMQSPLSGSVAKLTFFKQDNDTQTSDQTDTLSGTANTDNIFRWSGSPDYQFVYNLGTSDKTGGTYGVQLTLYASDGTTKLAQSDKYYFVLKS